MPKPSVAIVILNFNGQHFLSKFLPFVLATQYENFTVVVADNASQDNSVEYVKNNFPEVEIIINSTNQGFAGGYNWALNNVQSDYYVLLNSDVEVTPNWLNPIIDVLETDKTIAAAQPKILDYNNQCSFEYAGACGGWMDMLGYPFSRGRVFDVLENDKGQYNTQQDIFWASGAALFIRSHLFHQIGGFDASFFAHQEEIDLCWRLQLLGYRIINCPDSVVYHVGAGTLPRGGKKVYLNFRNNLLMLHKNLPLSESVWKIPFRFILDAISAWKGLLSGDTSFFVAIFKAHYSCMLIWLSKKPKQDKLPKLPLGQLKGVYPKSVVWEYFVCQKKTFQQIILS